MLPSTQQEFPKDYAFSLFPQLPGEIRNYIWKICVKDYPARIVDLREYRRPASESLSPETRSTLKSLTESSSGDFQTQKEADDTREIIGFKSRVPAPTVLYICRDSRYFAQELYSKAFGTADMPAETWIDFKKDMLYLSAEFCYLALDGAPHLRYFRDFPGRPYGYFSKELSQDMKKVKDLAISGIWELDLSYKWVNSDTLEDLYNIKRHFGDLERITYVEAQHAPDLTADLAFADISQHTFTPVQEFGRLRDMMLDGLYVEDADTWFGLKPYPWFEFGTLVEAQQDYCITYGIRPRKTESRLVTEEDRERVIPDAEIRSWRYLYTIFKRLP